MAKVKEKLVERVVIGPKPITCHDSKGRRIVAQIGDTIHLPLRSAKTFARYLTSPQVLAAQATIAKAEAEAEEDTGVTDAKAEATKAEAEAAAQLNPAASVDVNIDASPDAPTETEDSGEDDGGDSDES